MELVGVIAVIVLAVFVNGLVAKVEDDSPGGLNNADGKWGETLRKPTFLQRIVWASGVLVTLWLIMMWATR